MFVYSHSVTSYSTYFAQYDLLTAPITTSALYSRVSAILSRHTPHDHSTAAQVHDHPVLQSLDCASSDRCETHLWPSSDLSHLILTSSFWIDLASPDPLIADVSRQVFSLEIQYASFCGAPNIFVRGPRVETLSHDGLSQYARAIQEALWQARGTHIHISFSMTEQSNFEDSIFDLSAHVRPQYRNDKASQDDDAVDPMASWDAWNFIRSFCNYSTRLHAGKEISFSTVPLLQIGVRDCSNLPLSSRRFCLDDLWVSRELRVSVLPIP